jgi:hypothetical protein
MTWNAAFWAAVFLAVQAPPRGQGPGGPGRYEGELRDRQGPLLRVSMQAPERWDPRARVLGLLLVFHGMNGNERNYIGGTLEGLERLKLSDQYVVISGKSKGPGWTLEDDGPVILRLIEWAKETYPIDPRRVFLWGGSNGAGFVGRFGWQHQDKIAGIVGYCGYYNFAAPARPEEASETRPEWYFVHGGNDNPQNSGNACRQLREMGYRYVFRKLDGYGHTDIWDGAGHPDKSVVDAVRDDYMLWIHGLRHKQVEPAPRDREMLSWFENKSKAESLFGSRSTFLALQRIGGPQAGAAIVQALRSRSAGARAAAAEACETVSFGRAACEELARVAASDESDRAAHAALRALGTYATWNYPEAQAALARIALGGSEGRSGKLADRLLAAEGLARATRLAGLGNFEDARVAFRALVRLLDDEEARLRQAAFAALARFVKDGFGYSPGASAAARRDARARWEAWCVERCGPEETPK